MALLENAPHWFARWREAKDRRRPHFPELRRLCDELRTDFAAANDAIGAAVDLGAFRDILAAAQRHAPILNDLG